MIKVQLTYEHPDGLGHAAAGVANSGAARCCTWMVVQPLGHMVEMAGFHTVCPLWSGSAHGVLGLLGSSRGSELVRLGIP